MDRRRFLLAVPGVALATRSVLASVQPLGPSITAAAPITLTSEAVSAGSLARYLKAELQGARVRAVFTTFVEQDGDPG